MTGAGEGDGPHLTRLAARQSGGEEDLAQQCLTEPQGPVNRAETMLNDATGSNSSC